MSIVNYDAIINGTPEKVLLNKFREMKNNYTEESAREYSSLYNNRPLSFVIENSRLIFSEPYYGLSFYKEMMEDVSLCNFNIYESELDKVESFIEESGNQMDVRQKQMYEDLATSIKSMMEKTSNTRIYTDYIKEKVNSEFENKLSGLIYEYKKGDTVYENHIVNLFKESDNNIINLTYIPYVTRNMNSSELNKIVSESLESTCISSNPDINEWKSYEESVICANKLACDSLYNESLDYIYNPNEKILFEYFINTSLDDKLNQLAEEHVNIDDVCHVTPVSAVNNIFLDMIESQIDKDENDKYKNTIKEFTSVTFESSLDILLREYQMVDDTGKKADGYFFVSNESTLDEAFNTLTSLYNESSNDIFVTESEDNEDVSDEDIDNMDNDVRGTDSGKKPQAPKPKNLANKIQFSAMDKEAKRNAKKAKLAQKGQEIKNAAIAATSLPRNAIKSIKDLTHKFDEADDERRKKFMTEPGFRKKAFRNLKLAILYGGAADIKLSFVPVVAVCRHFSKAKDVRIRNELVRELETELSVCEEKINDANSKGDEKEKYRLMRIRDRLKTEITRVKLNSKYV